MLILQTRYKLELINLNLIKLLLSYKIDPSVKNKAARTPLCEALACDYGDCINALFDVFGISRENSLLWTQNFFGRLYYKINKSALLTVMPNPLLGFFLLQDDKFGRAVLEQLTSQEKDTHIEELI